MTISTTESTAVFDGNGATTVFPFTFPFIQDSDLKVYQKVVATGVITELVAGFTKAGAGSASGGSVTFSVAPATGIKIIVSREVVLTQSTDLRNQGDFYPETHEDAFDRMTMQIQQIAEQVDRSVKVDIAADTNPDDLIASISAAANAADASAAAASSSASAASGSAGASASSAGAASGSAAAAAASALEAAANKANTDTLRVDVASAGTVNLTSSAPNTRHINITGATTINGFTVAAGQCYFVRFNAALTLTNNANIVTQSGANITTAAGDTCILRATAANVVEVLAYTPFAYPFTREYVSSEQTITAGATTTLAHGLGVIPKLVSVTAICKIAELGYSVGQEAMFDADTTTAGSYNAATYADSSNIYARMGATGIAFQNASGSYLAATPANWRMILRAWA